MTDPTITISQARPDEEAAYAVGRRRAWQRIEVSAPGVEDLPGTVAFYEGEGFWEKGPLMARRFDL